MIQFKRSPNMEPKSSKTIITARNLTRIYALGGSEVIGIDTIDLSIAAGELVILQGDSGSGKSTLLSLLAGLDRPTRGELTVADHDLTTATPANLTHFRRKVVGMVFQAFNLMPTLNVLENASLPGLLAGKNPTAVKSKAIELLDWLGLSLRRDHFPAQLSGGEMQRVALSRALVRNPSIFLMDEPTRGVDVGAKEEIHNIIRKLSKEGCAIIVFSSELPEIVNLCDRIILMYEGEIRKVLKNHKDIDSEEIMHIITGGQWGAS